MNEVTLSQKYEIVIPDKVRAGLGLSPGDRLRVFRYGTRIEMIPVREICELRGILEGVDCRVVRDRDRF